MSSSQARKQKDDVSYFNSNPNPNMEAGVVEHAQNGETNGDMADMADMQRLRKKQGFKVCPYSTL